MAGECTFDNESFATDSVLSSIIAEGSISQELHGDYITNYEFTLDKEQLEDARAYAEHTSCRS